MLGSHARNDLTLSPYDKDLFLYLYLCLEGFCMALQCFQTSVVSKKLQSVLEFLAINESYSCLKYGTDYM